MTIRRVIFLALLAILALAACGEPSEEATSSTAAGSPPTTTPPSETTTTGADAGEAPDLTGDWNVTHVHTPEFGGVANLWPGTEITLRLNEDGTLSGNGGCNDFTGRYEVSGPYVTDRGFDDDLGQAMTISDLAWTDKLCEPESTMTQEAEFFEAMQKVEQWWIGEGFGGDNDLLLTSLDDGLMVEGSR